MDILGLIPARAGSKGIPGKNIRHLGGKPLIAYTFAAARGSRLLTRVVLSTDSPAIARMGREEGIEVPFLRPKRLAGDKSPASDYIRHCLEFLQKKEGRMPDLVVLLQPTAPLRNAADIDACVELMLRRKAGAVVSVGQAPAHFHPAWQFVMDGQWRLVPWGGSWTKVGRRRQDLAPTWVRNGAVYVFGARRFMATGSLYCRPVLAYPMANERSANIDDPEDWAKAEVMLRKCRRGMR